MLLQVLDTDPLSPTLLGDVYLEYVLARQWEQALSISKRLVALHMNNPDALRFDPLAYERLGRHEEALAALEKLRAASASDLPLRVSSGVVLAQMGKRAEAEKILADLKGVAKKERTPDYIDMARLSFALGHRDQGFAYLDQAYEARDQRAFRAHLAFLNRREWSEGVRDDPRFAALQKRIGVPTAYIH